MLERKKKRRKPGTPFLLTLPYVDNDMMIFMGITIMDVQIIKLLSVVFGWTGGNHYGFQPQLIFLDTLQWGPELSGPNL